MTTKTRPQLPRIVRFDGRTDSGEFGATSCPHCNADGRYVFHFLCEDGVERGAMAGCIKLFPVAKVAEVHKALLVKESDYGKKGWKLPSWDLRKLEAIEAFYQGEKTEQECMSTITEQVRRAKEYRARQGKRY